ncbi:hypothetical protein H4219_006134 [Mycoemilia scoparia]|uniref:Hydroxysteroid dehydrogenase-like protein 2 n=1 Tax=Mycoemilia scoparia TaxID=417184 RepID=A0A9W7ZJN3_9FUNG|nr:hypothetical protein H4219_006134 [Mycoemilia scoparia]
MPLNGMAVLITGGSRGIGKEIAIRAAQDGAKVAILAKTAEPHPKVGTNSTGHASLDLLSAPISLYHFLSLPGTIFSAAREIEQAGGKALPIQCDIRDEDQVKSAIQKVAQKFGASAISLTDTEHTSVKKYDLMHQINARGTWMISKYCIPHLKKSSNPHILNMSSPLSMESKWFSGNVAYTMAKYGMSMCVLGMSEELKKYKIAVNALWPMTLIETAAMQAIGGQDQIPKRKPAIMADAAHWILTQDSTKHTGRFFLDELLLRQIGVTNFEKYNTIPGTKLEDLGADFFLDQNDVDEVLKLRMIGENQDALLK